MNSLEVIFWIGVAIVFYAYLGYGLLLWFCIKIKRLLVGNEVANLAEKELPQVTFIVAAYNEGKWMEEKIANCLSFHYPKDRIEFWFVTDGSTDDTPDLIKNYPAPPGIKIHLHHQPERRGKIAAVERVMPLVKSPVTVFTDANTTVNPEAIRHMVRHYADPKVGAVAGEKRIALGKKGDATGAGEGIYWKYESKLKKWDSELYSTIGAAGELFSIRTGLFRPVPQDTLIEDFVMTMRIAMKGYRIVYEPMAYAVEGQSASIKEELKRKIRIAAGGLQAAWRLRALLNPFRYGVLSFQYWSHRFFRWTLAPLALPLVFLTNLLLALQGNSFYRLLFIGQVIFYSLALCGWLLERQQMKIKAFFVPYYFCVMNYAMYRGFFRLISGRQSVVWEKAKRLEE
jgi:cellulose synthase/poly-beta-1,6-N-acetylglucosamine synthase-like glycosyltransferase